MEYYTGVLQHPETHKQYYPITLWDLIVGKPTNFSDVHNSTINLYAGTQASHTSIGSFSVNSSSNVDIYFPVVSTQAMGLVPVLDSDTNHYLRGDGTWATPAGSDTTYQLTLNGTTNGDSTGGVDLGTLYAPTGAGTSGYILKSNGSGAPSWDTLINIIGSKTEHHVLAGNSSGNVSWQQLNLDALSDTPTENKITLNGTDYAKFLRSNGTSGDLTFYAPASGKATNNLLLSQGTGANPPTWTNFTFPTSGTTKTLNYVGGTGWTIQELISAASTSSNYHGHLLLHPVSGGNQEMKYNTQVFTGFDGSTGYVLAGNTSSNIDMVYLQGSLTTPILLKSGSNVIPNKLIHSSGVIAAPTGSSGDTKYLKADIGNNNSVTFGWATISGGGGYPSLTMPSAEFSVTGSGTSSITVSKQSQNVGTVWAAPANSNGAPSFRRLVVTDIPDLGNVSPKHYDAWMGQGISGSQTIGSMDAPFYCTDLRNPNVFPTLGNQWGYDSAAILPWHLTIWPKGNHSLTSSVSTSYQNWLACMMTSWAAGHPMSVSFVVSERREWIPLIYTGPLKVSDGNNGYKVITVAIDLGAAIILTLLNYGYIPFTGSDLTSITSTFNSKMSIGMNPITFRWFSEYTNGCGNKDLGGAGKVMDFINGQIPSELQKEFSGFTAISRQDIEDNISYWHKHSGSGSIVENTTIGDGAVFKTWAEIAADTSTYKYGVLVCTALPNITGIQQSI